MRLVVDTNVLFSALYQPDSSCGRILLLAIEGEIELFAPETVRAELERVLRGKLAYSDDEWHRALAALPVDWVEAAVYHGQLARAMDAIADPTDAPVLALALALRAGIVSGDKAFHPLRKRIAKTWRPRDAATEAPKLQRPRGSKAEGKRRRR